MMIWGVELLAVGQYLDFRRLRAEEAAMRRTSPHGLRFDRADWIEARAAELAWRAHMRRRGCTTYLECQAPPVFRIH